MRRVSVFRTAGVWKNDEENKVVMLDDLGTVDL